MKGKTERILRALLAAAVFSALLLLPASASAAAKIPASAKVYKGHSYQLYDKPMTWTEAKKYCKKLGGNLVTITSKGEKNFVVKQLKNCKSNWYWIGLRKTSGTWKLVTGEKANYFNWASVEPSGDGDYAQLYGKAIGEKAVGAWNDVPNESWTGFYAKSEGGFICEWNAVYKGLSKEKMTLKLGDSQTLKVLRVPGTVKWSSSNAKVAPVSSKGAVKAVKPGTATIRAKVGGKTYSCKVTVKNNDAKAGSLKFVTTDGGMFVQQLSSAKISFKLDKASADVVVSVKSASGSTVYSKKYPLCKAKKTYSFTWNGKKKSGGYANAGTYTVTVKAGATVTTSESLTLCAREFAGGTGSASNPFQVASFEQFKKVENYNGCSFIQTADLDGGGVDFAGMFSASVPFTGTYDGNGHTISNLFLNAPDNSDLALFAYIGEKGKVMNLTLSNIYATGANSSTVKLAVFCIGNSGAISDCAVRNGNASLTKNGEASAAIFCRTNGETGRITGCSVENCTINCRALGMFKDAYAGGLVAYNKGKIIDCKISSSQLKVSTGGAAMAGSYRAGGIVLENSGVMINCSAADVSIEAERSGGICYRNSGIITNCSFTGTATEKGVHSNSGTVN